MSDEALKQKIHDVLKTSYFNGPDDLVDVSDGFEDNLHVVIVSRKFDGKRLKEKSSLVWSLLTKFLAQEEWGKVSLLINASPDEIKAGSTTAVAPGVGFATVIQHAPEDSVASIAG